MTRILLASLAAVALSGTGCHHLVHRHAVAHHRYHHPGRAIVAGAIVAGAVHHAVHHAVYDEPVYVAPPRRVVYVHGCD